MTTAKLAEANLLVALAEVRTWLGTPWVHQGRVKGKACDCIGLAVAAAHALGVVTPAMEADFPHGYRRIPHNNSFQAFVEKHLDEVTIANAQVLDVILIKGARYATHIGVLGNFMHAGTGAPFSILHAMIQSRMVSESRYDPQMWSALGFYRFREPV